MSLLTNPAYDPNRLLNELLERFNIKNDAALSRMLGLDAPVISKIRSKRRAIAPGTLMRFQDKTGIHANELRKLMGVETVEMSV